VSRIVFFGTYLTQLDTLANPPMAVADLAGNSYLADTNSVPIDRVLSHGGPYTDYYPVFAKESQDGQVARSWCHGTGARRYPLVPGKICLRRVGGFEDPFLLGRLAPAWQPSQTRSRR
jgi:hypothetical protein